MPYTPKHIVTDEERRAIQALCGEQTDCLERVLLAYQVFRDNRIDHPTALKKLDFYVLHSAQLKKGQSFPTRNNKGWTATKGSAFSRSVSEYFGIGTAQMATQELQRWGIDPRTLVALEARGGNGICFKLGTGLIVKVLSEFDRLQKMPLTSCPPILPTLYSAYVGFDPGGAPIAFSISPLLETEKVQPWHVRALCYELYTSHQLLFSDNKLNNVGLDKNGVPYVIDSGAVKPITEKSPLEAPFYYPEWCGFDTQTGKWASGASAHGLEWPRLSEASPCYQAAKQELAALTKSKPTHKL